MAGEDRGKPRDFTMWRCADCQREFPTDYGLRMHRVNEHGAPRRTVRRTKRRTQGSTT